MKTKIDKTAKLLGFIPKYQAMSEDQTGQFMSILISNPKEEFEEMLSGEDAPFPI